MRCRSLIALAVVVVLAMSTMAANASAISGASGKGSAAQAEYPDLDPKQRLPFTGFEAIALLLGGAALAATGLALRRAVRTNPS